MNLETEKIELARKVLETEDASLLLQIRHLFEDQDELAYDKLPDHVKEGISRSEKQIENGEVHSYQDVKKHIFQLLK